ncbi:LysM peptidoglycan-binding and 3D domain-containing protein [Neobacillus ginsengisoli]|uniref:3D (Asp-Asp-Asp) domain-containing protein/LysM repeat protein n=1 Tax=Neobacillus ginsengisoli TaxID=904295 RepID=A0ABT9XQD6_9BACI|nr:LysM peptidoglycan-binding and 3D domain-containing protein [Neobacillus ginsengisoli]MDQ0197766.1 3D (Asp-Asp-Asp) domain-containing protein/LysM repeat protein [Neobacillus ginsengisoli]
MINKIKTFIAVAALSGTVGANVQAADITVKKGDTLWDLSRVHNTSVENIQKWNHLSTDLIHPGDVLTIATEKHYIVKKGDTLWDIAIENHVTVEQIMEWNKLTSDLIHPGLNLVIYDGLNATNKTVTEKQVQTTAPAAAVSSVTKGESTSKVESTPKPTVQAPKESTPAVKPASTSGSGSREITVKATAYTASCGGCSGITATGINLKANPNAKVISVDPSVIPLGSKVYVEGYGEAIAGDTGGAIKGNRIDVFIPSQQDAINFGSKQLKVTILN